MILKEGYVVKIKDKRLGTSYDGSNTSDIYTSKAMAERKMKEYIHRGWEAEVITARVIVDDDEGEQNERPN